jgi:hypothetical protein
VALRHENGKRHIQNVRLFDVLHAAPAAQPVNPQAPPADIAIGDSGDDSFCNAERFDSVHGPALDDDPPHTIYDDFTGAMAEAQPRPDSFESFPLPELPELGNSHDLPDVASTAPPADDHTTVHSGQDSNEGSHPHGKHVLVYLRCYLN